MGLSRLDGNESDRIKGFVLFNEVEYPFLYSDNVLEIFPQKEQVQNESFSLFWDQLSIDSNEKKFVRNITLSGKTSYNKDIKFEVSEQYSNDNGFIHFDVKSVYVYKDKEMEYTELPENISDEPTKSEKQNNIRGMIITGREIDYYYSPSLVFSRNVKFSDDRKRVLSMQITTNESDEIDCGIMRWENVDIRIKIRSVAVMKPNSPIPFTGHSEMIFEFSNAVEISFVKKLYISVYTCFGYLNRRTNIKLDPTKIFDIMDPNGRNYFGVYTLNLGRDTNENHKKAMSRTISHQILEGKFSILLEQFLLRTIYINNIPKSVEETHKYRPDRIIFNFVAFEREFRNIYKENVTRSEEYLDAKSSILEVMDKIVDSSSGKKKKYLNSFRKTIEKSENSFGDRLSTAFTAHEPCLTPFFIQNYGKEYKSKIEDICIRLNQLRNDSAHGNIDLEILPEHGSDFEILEKLLYAMRLKFIGISDRRIQQAINDLMDCNIYIPKEEISD